MHIGDADLNDLCSDGDNSHIALEEKYFDKFKHVFSSKLYLYLKHLGRRLVADTTILQNLVTDQVNLAHWITDKNNMVQD